MSKTPAFFISLALISALTGCAGSAAAKSSGASGSGGSAADAAHSSASSSGLRISSPAFADGQPIPAKYSCDDANVSPPLDFAGVPTQAQSLALIVDDPDAPSKVWVHWLVWNIDPKAKSVAAGALPAGTGGAAVQGRNDFGREAWGGPCPPDGTHHYRFKLFALSAPISLTAEAEEREVEEAMEGILLGKAELTGTYSRDK